MPARPIAERRATDHFRDHGALSPETAVACAPDRWSRARALARLRDLGVVKGGEGGLYLDEIVWDARTGKRRKRAGARRRERGDRGIGSSGGERGFLPSLGAIHLRFNAPYGYTDM